MKRRHFSTTLFGFTTCAGLSIPWAALAQNEPVEGRHYVRLGQPVPISAAPGKLEVIDFFWYGCPHCAAFEPLFESWTRRLPDDVVYRRVPVAFRAEPYGSHQRLFYALESMGLVEKLHKKVFYAIHVQHKRLDSLAEMQAFMTANGVDANQFAEAFNSFGVQVKQKQATQLAEAYRIDGVPAMGIQGRFYTSKALTGDDDRMLAVIDFLLDKLRKAKK